VGAGSVWLFLDEKEVNERLEAKMCEALDAVLKTTLKYKVDMRTAAYIVAIESRGNGHANARDVRVRTASSFRHHLDVRPRSAVHS
jgi:hypothetical protein